jgi:hypothetical protein
MMTLALGLLFASPALAFSEPLLGAIDLPVVAEQLRDDGVADEDVRQALLAARETRLSASEARNALKVADVEARKHGPLAAFGEFLKRQLHLGKRGKALETAIRDEHRKSGVTLREDKPRKPHVKRAAATAAPVVDLDPKAKKKEERRLRKEQRAQERRERRAVKHPTADDVREARKGGGLLFGGKKSRGTP